MELLRTVDPDDRPRLFWRLQATGWAGVFLLTSGTGSALYGSVADAVLLGLFRALYGFALTSVILRPVLRSMRTRQCAGSPPCVAAIVVACALLGWGDMLFTTGLSSLFPIDLDRPGLRRFLVASIVIRGVLYGFWCILYFAVHYRLDTERDRLRTAEAEAAARASELQMLRSQVNPHFLFNALNSILAESEKPESVKRITLALADYLRFSLEQRDETGVLGEELEALENYLRVEKARFEDGFEYTVDAEAAARRTPVPVALIQPLLENAMKYGRRSSGSPLRVAVRAGVEQGVLTVSVANTGEWVEETVSSTRTGLANLRRRLDLLYRGGASLTTESGNGMVRVRVSLPVAGASDRTAPEELQPAAP